MFPGNYFPGNYFAVNFWPPVTGKGPPGTPGTPPSPVVDPTWENARTLTRVTRGTHITTAAIPPGDWVLLIKAFDTSGNESENATEYLLTVFNDNDVVLNQVEDPRWTGNRNVIEGFGKTKEFIKHDVSNTLVPESKSIASDSGWDTFDKFVFNPLPIVVYATREEDLGFDSFVRVYAELVSKLGPGETVGGADPLLFVDHRTSTSSYDGFAAWTVGSAEMRFIKSRIHIDTTTGVSFLVAATIVLDVPERTEGAKSVTVASGGTTITYETPFHFPPRIKLTVDSSGTALFPTKSNVTETSFIARIWNVSGDDVGGVLDWEAEGA